MPPVESERRPSRRSPPSRAWSTASGGGLPAPSRVARRDARGASPPRSSGAGRLLLLRQVHGAAVATAPWDEPPEADAARRRRARARCSASRPPTACPCCWWTRGGDWSPPPTPAGAGRRRACSRGRARARGRVARGRRTCSPPSGPGSAPAATRWARSCARPSARRAPAFFRAGPEGEAAPRRARRQRAPARGRRRAPGVDPPRRRVHLLPPRPLPLLPARRQGRRAHDQLRRLHGLSGLEVRPLLVHRAVGERVGLAVAARAARARAAPARSGRAAPAPRGGAAAGPGSSPGSGPRAAAPAAPSPRTPRPRSRPRASAKRRPCSSAWYSATLLVALPEVAVERRDRSRPRGSVTWTPKPASPGLPRLAPSTWRRSACGAAHGSATTVGGGGS